MRLFAVTLRSGKQILGLGLSGGDLSEVRAGNPIFCDMSSVDVGLWTKDRAGQRSFIQPRDSHVLVMTGESAKDIGDVLNVDLSQEKE